MRELAKIPGVCLVVKGNDNIQMEIEREADLDAITRTLLENGYTGGVCATSDYAHRVLVAPKDFGLI